MPTPEARDARLRVIVPGRNWWQAFLLAISVNSGYSSLARPESITPTWQRLLPDVLHGYWCWSLIGGGAIALVAVLMRPGLLPTLIERVGLMFIGGACFAYTLGLVLFVGFRSQGAITRELMVGIFAALVAHRLIQINALLRYARGENAKRNWWRA